MKNYKDYISTIDFSGNYCNNINCNVDHCGGGLGGSHVEGYGSSGLNIQENVEEYGKQGNMQMIGESNNVSSYGRTRNSRNKRKEY